MTRREKIEERLAVMRIGHTTIVFGEVVTRHSGDAFELRTLGRASATLRQIADVIATEIERDAKPE